MSKIMVYIAIIAVVNRRTFLGIIRTSIKMRLGVTEEDYISFGMNVMRALLLLIFAIVIIVGGKIE